MHPVKVREKTLRFRTRSGSAASRSPALFILIATGILLMFYYHPSVPQAYRDMKELDYVVDNGLFLRNLHRWAAHLMVFAAFLHMLRVFYHRAYRPPRQFNWVVGVVLLLVTLLLSYTGYLLPWDQLAFWGVSVGTNMAKEAPLSASRSVSCFSAGTWSPRTRCCASTSSTASCSRSRCFSALRPHLARPQGRRGPGPASEPDDARARRSP